MGTIMANTAGSVHGSGAETIGDDGDNGACQARDLVGLLERITSQISESERRQSETLAEMLSRLDALGAEARSYRGRVPEAYLPAFERIEDGVAMLAERIATVRDDAPVATVASESAPAPHADVQSFADLKPTVAPEAEAPAAPAMSAADQTIAPASDSVDTETIFANDGSAWDEAAAEALTRHYEQGLAAFTSPAVMAPSAPSAAATRPAGPSAPAARALGGDVERAWLEERFADIARRVEENLLGATQDATLSQFGNRFDKLEERFGSALEGIATRSDVESLGLLEAHIVELTQQFDDARNQLARLDGIEQTLAAVVDRLTDPRFDEILVRGGAPEADLDVLISSAVEQISSRLKSEASVNADFAGLADAAAERVASRFADMNSFAAPEAGSGDIQAIRQILEHFINERREGDDQTAAMLDTMQQAMLRVLDRVDHLEMSQGKSAPQEFVREQVRFGGLEATPAAGAQKAFDAASAFAAETRGTAYEPRKPAPPSLGQTTGEEDAARPFDIPTRETVPLETMAGAKAAFSSNKPESASASIERLRHDFIADAQRAKKKLDAAASEGGDGATDEATAPAKASRTPITETAPTATMGKPRPQVAASEAPAKSASVTALVRMPSRKVLVSALVLLVAIPGIIMLAQKRAARSNQPPAAAAQVEAPAAVSRPGEAPATTQPAVDTVAPPPGIERTPFGQSTEQGPQGQSEQPAAKDVDSKVDAPKTAPDRSSNLEETTPATQGNAGATVAPANVASNPGAVPLAPVGIHLATPAKRPTLEQLARLSERQQMAELSGKLGAAQVPSPTLAALIPDAATPGNGDAASRDSGVDAASDSRLSAMVRKPLNLPDATIGPMSLRMAAANGDPSAEFEVGARFAEANGVAQNFAEAARWYQRSATQGFAQSQYRLATLFERGLGVKQDVARAKVWYQRAAEGGNVKAMHNLAVLTAGKTAKAPDYAAASTWFQAAAERGLADSQFNLAVLYEGGLGVAKDAKTAYKWYAIASRSGDQEAVRRRDELERLLTATDLTAVRGDISAWHSSPVDRLANDARVAGEDWKKRESASGAI